MEIEAHTMAQAHQRAVQAVLDYGVERETENNEATLEIPEPLGIKIHSPHMPPYFSGGNPHGQAFLDEYVKSVMSIRPRFGDDRDFSYTYGNRIWDHPQNMVPYCGEETPFKCGDGWGEGISQVPITLIKLEQHPTTRRAVIGTWNVELDIKLDAPPCIDLIQLFRRPPNTVDMIIYIRSNDMLSAYGDDIYALYQLQKFIASAIVPPHQTGMLYTISASAHIYYKRDETELDKMKRYIYARV